MNLRLHGSPISRAFRCIWALEELQLDFELVPVDFANGEHLKNEFLSKNPMGKVPVLDVDGEFIFESAAIVTYLAQLKPEANLIPAVTSLDYGKCMQWLFFGMSELEQPLWTLAKHKFALPRELRTSEIKNAAIYEWEKAAQVVDTHLNDNEYMLGERFTVADIIVGQTLFWAQKLEGVKVDYPNFKNYMRRLKTRERFPNIKKYL